MHGVADQEAIQELKTALCFVTDRSSDALSKARGSTIGRLAMRYGSHALVSGGQRFRHGHMHLGTLTDHPEEEVQFWTKAVKHCLT